MYSLHLLSSFLLTLVLSAFIPQLDYIVCSETAEHFYDPHKEFTLLSSLLKTGGTLAVMTFRPNEKTDWSKWWYRTDPTHVNFYKDATFTYMAQNYGFHPKPDFISDSVCIFEKQDPTITASTGAGIKRKHCAISGDDESATSVESTKKKEKAL